jgi:hypothetical protein
MLKILINNGDGLGPVDYTRYVIPSSIEMDDSINTPTLLSFSLSNIDSVFKPPVRSAYVQWVNTVSPLALTGQLVYTGFITNNSEFKYQGLTQAAGYTGAALPGPYAQGGPYFQNYEIDVKVTSDEYLLNIKAVPFIAAYVNQTMGQILKNIATVLAPGYFDLTNIQDGDLVPYFAYDPTSKWSDVAKTFADTAQFRYHALGKKLYFTPYGDVPLGIIYDETSQRQAQFVPSGLETGILAVPLVNDALVIGDVEPQQFHDDYFCGDGFTGNFPLKYNMFQGSTNLLLQDDWTENQFNQSLWFVQDLSGQFVLAGALNDIGTGSEGPLGQAYILGQSGVELGGHVVLQHGEFQFNDHSTGIVGGIYNTEATLSGANCIAGFQISCSASVTVTASGADGIIMQPILSGAQVGAAVTSVHNHHYVLQTTISAKEAFRYQQVYRSLAGTPFGNYYISALGDVTYTITDIDLGQAYNIATLNNPFVPAYIPVVTKYTAFSVPLPEFCAYVILNSGGVDPNYSPPVVGGFGALNLDVNYSMIYKPPQANLYVKSLTGAQPTNSLALTGGQLPPYDPEDPLADEDTFPVGPYVHYAMGFGLDYDLTGTITQGGDYATLEFYSPLKIPGVGARVKLQGWQAGNAVARVQDPVSIAREAAIVGDNGLRSAIINDIKPAPRTSYDCDLAAQATIEDREMVQYQGTYQLESSFWDPTQDIPRSGRFLNVTAPGRGISGQQFLVREVTTTVLEMRSQLMLFNISYGQDLYLDKLLRRFIAQPEGTTGVLQANDTALAPNPQQLPAPETPFNTYLGNLPNAQAVLITGTQVVLDLGSTPVTGVEIRRSDTGWASNAQNLITVATTREITLPRSIWDQTWFLRQVNGAQTSRFTRVIRVNYPMVPLPPSSVAVSFGSAVTSPTGTQGITNPQVTVALPTSFDRNIYGVQIEQPLANLFPPGVACANSTFTGDSRTVTFTGLDQFGNYVTDTITLDGTVTICGTVVFSVLLSADVEGSPFGGPLEIITDSLPDASWEEFYSVNFQATGGNPPYMWSVVAGTLPPGLSLASDGTFSGTPTTPGTYDFTVKVQDSLFGEHRRRVIMRLG